MGFEVLELQVQLLITYGCRLLTDKVFKVRCSTYLHSAGSQRIDVRAVNLLELHCRLDCRHSASLIADHTIDSGPTATIAAMLYYTRPTIATTGLQFTCAILSFCCSGPQLVVGPELFT
jgi:hypothetical protein